MNPHIRLRHKGLARVVLFLVLGLALGVLGLITGDMMMAAFGFGLGALFAGFLLFASKEKRNEGLLRVAIMDPTAGSPRVPMGVVVAVLVLFFAFLTYVALKHHI